MARDTSATRPRQNSSASKPFTHPTSQFISPLSASLTASSNPHLTEPLLQPFLSPTFDPAAYLNAQLPPLKPRTSSTSNTASRSSTPSNNEATLADLSASTQTLLSQLSAHTSRLTTTLSELTDAILRGGAKLAYEVEVLHGEIQGLREALGETLKDDIEVFVPGGIEKELELPPITARARSSTLTVAVESQSTAINEDTKHTDNVKDQAKMTEEPDEPGYIKELKKLTTVREMLDSVIKTFDSALNWTFPPSEVSVSSSLISVSAPEPGSEAASVEEKGQAVSKKLRSEIMDMLTGGTSDTDGIVKARQRITELKTLCDVWKGTAEEKARVRFVDGLQKMVDEKEREIERKESIDNKREQTQVQPQTTQQTPSTLGGYGFINQLQKMRGGI